jgi:hypothetical protein
MQQQLQQLQQQRQQQQQQHNLPHLSCTKMRLVLLQICPLVQNAPNMTHSTALSRSVACRQRAKAMQTRQIAEFGGTKLHKAATLSCLMKHTHTLCYLHQSGPSPASSNMMSADLPPSSSVDGRRLAVAASATRRPVVVLPVKATLAMPGWALATGSSRCQGKVLGQGGGLDANGQMPKKEQG